MPKYLVTGGAGFIGSHIVQQLVKQGESVRVLDNCSTGREENLEGFREKIEFIHGDIRDLSLVKETVKDVDFILHQAALPSIPRSIADPIATNEVNVTGTLNVLTASRDAAVKRVVYASSSSIYGVNPDLPKTEEMPSNPIAPYAISKSSAEQYCKVFYDIYGLETVSLRYFNVFGPKQDPNSQYSAVIPLFISAYISGDPPKIYGDGEQTRDFTYVENVVFANLLACHEKEAPGQLFNIACGKRTTINKLAKTIKKLLDAGIEPKHTKPREGDVRHSMADISKARRVLGYEPKVYIEEGLEKTIEWYKSK